jgi:hypothetical protein
MSASVELRESRRRFFSALALLVGGCLLILAGATLPAVASAWVGFGVGLGAFGCSLLLLSEAIHSRSSAAVRPLPALAGLTVLAAAWQPIQALVLPLRAAKWVTFGDGWALSALAVAALVAHELSTQRVVYFLEVLERGKDSGDGGGLTAGA